MNVAHYFLGFPPYRTGGLTTYAYNLAVNQAERGDKVFCIWQGKCKKNFSIQSPKLVRKGLFSVEIQSNLLIPLTFGVKNPKEAYGSCSSDKFREFFKRESIEILYVHTLMGIFSEMLQAAKAQNIKIIYITHDYYGLCPKVFGFYSNKNCSFCNFEDCVRCNKNGLSRMSMHVLQSKLYRKIKDFKFVKNLRNIFKKKKKEKNVSSLETVCEADAENYESLQKYYLDCLNQFDKIFCNSYISYKVFAEFVDKNKLQVIPITHNAITDNREIHNYSGKKRKIIYLGPESVEKGFYRLLSILDKYEDVYNFELKVYGKDNFEQRKYLKYCGSYNYSQLGLIFANADFLVVPSVWNETFGFVLLEAYSYGLPVLCSDTVGAGYLVDKNFIFGNNNFEEKLVLLMENKDILEKENKRILEADLEYFFEREKYIELIREYSKN